jgi:hypothetical protein
MRNGWEVTSAIVKAKEPAGRQGSRRMGGLGMRAESLAPRPPQGGTEAARPGFASARAKLDAALKTRGKV